MDSDFFRLAAWRLRRLRVRVGFMMQRLRYALDRARGKPIVHLIHIGKTGGTALKAAIRQHWRDGHFIIYDHNHGWTLQKVRRGEKVIFFLRDPISRFVSGFYGRQRQDLPRIFSPWQPQEALAFQRFGSPNELALALSSGDPERKRHAEEAMGAIRHVRDTYYDWFGSDDALLDRFDDILFIGFQESLETDLEELKHRLGLPAAASLPDDEVRAHRNPQSIDRNLDEQALANLREWYAKDYHFYRFCAELRRRLPAEPPPISGQPQKRLPPQSPLHSEAI